MTDFTYVEPEAKMFFEALLAMLARDGHDEIVRLLRQGSCGLITSQSFSRRRWNAFWAVIELYLPMHIFGTEKIEVLEENKEIIRKVADKIMPGTAGYDIMEVKFLPSLELSEEPEIDEDEVLGNSIRQATEELQKLMIPDGLKERAKEMSEIYGYTYCAENSIRSLIENVSREAHGDEYLDQILTMPMKRKIEKRKNDAEKWRWIGARGDSDLYYLDFEDLASIIRNNWNLFSHLFPSQDWICVKITEMAKLRNPVAHHCLIGEDEKLQVKLSYRQILAQVQSHLD